MLELKIISPEESLEAIKCDSAHLVLSDDDLGKNGGSFGIRTGHIKSLLSVAKGNVTAFLDGKEIFCRQTEGGFATVENDTVTVVTEKIL